MKTTPYQTRTFKTKLKKGDNVKVMVGKSKGHIGRIISMSPNKGVAFVEGANIVIWTTTPWTIPGNRALACGSDLKYSLNGFLIQDPSILLCGGGGFHNFGI